MTFNFGDKVFLAKPREHFDREGERLFKDSVLGVVVGRAFNGDYTVVFEGEGQFNPVNGFGYSTHFYSGEYLTKA